MTDRLIRLSMTRAALRHYQLDSADAWRSATPEQRAQLEPDRRALIDRAIREDQTDVIAGLWSPVEWQVAMQPSGPGRYATVSSRAGDPDGERRGRDDRRADACRASVTGMTRRPAWCA